jgi:hypothetical protein
LPYFLSAFSVVVFLVWGYPAIELKTAYLLGSPNNAQKSMSAIEQLENDQGVERELLE